MVLSGMYGHFNYYKIPFLQLPLNSNLKSIPTTLNNLNQLLNWNDTNSSLLRVSNCIWFHKLILVK